MPGRVIVAPPAIIVGLSAEARLARRIGWPVAIGGGSAAGAAAAAHRMAAQGAGGLVSFGLAGGLDPALRPGALIMPVAVHTDGRDLPVDPDLARLLGGTTLHRLLGADTIAATATDKQRLWIATGAAAVDLESGAIATVAGALSLPFAVVRAICDPAERDLPPAALAALDQQGVIGIARVTGSLLANPGQLPALIALTRDAAAARLTLARWISHIMQRQCTG